MSVVSCAYMYARVRVWRLGDFGGLFDNGRSSGFLEGMRGCTGSAGVGAWRCFFGG